MNICNWCGYTFEKEPVVLDTSSSLLKFCCETCKSKFVEWKIGVFGKL